MSKSTLIRYWYCTFEIEVSWTDAEGEPKSYKTTETMGAPFEPAPLITHRGWLQTLLAQKYHGCATTSTFLPKRSTPEISN